MALKDLDDMCQYLEAHARRAHDHVAELYRHIENLLQQQRGSAAAASEPSPRPPPQGQPPKIMFPSHDLGTDAEAGGAPDHPEMWMLGAALVLLTGSFAYLASCSG
jgi:hypothetical protein